MRWKGSSGRCCSAPVPLCLSASLHVFLDLAVLTGNPHVLVQVTGIATACSGNSKLCVTNGEKTGRDLGCGTWQLLDFLSLPVPRHSWIQRGGRQERGERQTLSSARSSHFISASGRSGWASLEQPKKTCGSLQGICSLGGELGWFALQSSVFAFGAGTLPILAAHSCRDKFQRAEVCEF